MRNTALAFALVLGASIGAAATTAMAADAPAFEQVDVDQDGVISETEASAVPEIDFATADADGDGTLSRAEYEQALG